MAKLRKMLGGVNDPQIIALMGMIETQSRRTLARWAAGDVAAHCLPIYEAARPGDTRLREVTGAVGAHLDGALPLKELKDRVRAARDIPKGLEDAPAAQAAARAIVTACGVVQTPTNALGFTFYSAAAAAYHQAGTEAERALHDALAAAELDRLAASLRAVLIPDEPDPVKVSWNC